MGKKNPWLYFDKEENCFKSGTGEGGDMADLLNQARETKTYYSGFQIRAWKGRFKLYGSAEMIELALLSGIGARNSIGFGCLIQKEML